MWLSLISLLTLFTSALVFYASDHVSFLVHQRRQHPLTENLAAELKTSIFQVYTQAVTDLAGREEIRDVSSGNTSPDNPALLRVLNTVQGVLNVSLVYVMNSEGTVVGCSRSPQEMNLTGNNYRFRPYFLRAIAGKSHIFPAVGVTTNKKGLYFSAPIYFTEGGQPIGAMVIKAKGETLDSFFASPHRNLDALLVSPDGIIFAASQKQWNFRTAWPLAPNILQGIKSSRQFSSRELEKLPFSMENQIVHYHGTRSTVDYYDLQLDGWRIATLKPLPFPWLAVILLWCIIWSMGTLCIVIVLHAHKEKNLAVQVLAGKEASNLAREAYRNSVLELETIFSASLVGIILVREGRIANANQRMCEMFEYNLEEIIDCDVRHLFSGRRAFRRFIRRHLHLLIDRNIEQTEYDLRKKNGTLIPCMLSGKAIDRSKLSKGTVWVIEDISKRKAVEQELEQARKAAEAATVAKGEFLANMSHEIRTPMNGIIGLTNVLLGQDIPPAQREHLELIQKSAFRLMTIINDILDFSKLEAGRFEVEQHPFSVRRLLREVMLPMEPSGRKKNVQLNLTVDPGVPDTVLGDPTKVIQVLTNLIDNSLKFTEKGFVGVDVELKKDDSTLPGTLLFKISDTGIGINPTYQAKVFSSFSQADSSHSRKFGGTGLGLSISKSLVELMGGKIWFESVPDRGTSFYFTLPLVQKKAHPPGQAGAYRWEGNNLPEGNGKRVLVAEDEYINSVLIHNLLDQAGYHVTIVHGGREAVEACQTGVFDCILMDIQMPEMDGYEAVVRIRESEPADVHIPIIAMTAHALSGDRQKCLDAGMDDYVSKPIDGPMVLHMLRRYLFSPTERFSESQSEWV
jgi:PAS domain S-box-containing protein